MSIGVFFVLNKEMQDSEELISHDNGKKDPVDK